MVLTTVRSKVCVAPGRRWRSVCAGLNGGSSTGPDVLKHVINLFDFAAGRHRGGRKRRFFPSLIAPCLIIVKLIENYILADLSATRAGDFLFPISFYSEIQSQRSRTEFTEIRHAFFVRHALDIRKRPDWRNVICSYCAILLNGDLSGKRFFLGAGRRILIFPTIIPSYAM